MPVQAPIFTADTIVRRGGDIVFSRLDDEMLAIHSERGLCHSLNETAAVVWETMETPIAVRDVCVRLRRKYAVGEAECLSDVLVILAAMNANGLIEIADATAV